MIHDDMLGGGIQVDQQLTAGQMSIDPPCQVQFSGKENETQGGNLLEMDNNIYGDPQMIWPPGGDLSQIDSADMVKLVDLEDFVDLRTLEEQNVSRQGDVFPDLNEHDDAGFNFEMNLFPQHKSKTNWLYSTHLRKVFIKLDQTFHIDAMYTPKLPNENLCLRAMMVFTEDISAPVCRCHNHSNNSNDLELEDKIKYNVLRGEHSAVQYHGERNGKNVSDRLSVLIPLSYVKPNEDNMVKQTIALKFVCQNSCIGRKETAVIFTLERQSGEVLSKRIVKVKICSCPNRDKIKEERKFKEEESTGSGLFCPAGKKPAKIAKILKIKDEPNFTKPLTPPLSVSPPKFEPKTPEPFQAREVELCLKLPNNEAALHVLDCAFNYIAGQMAWNPENSSELEGYLRTLKKKRVEQLNSSDNRTQ